MGLFDILSQSVQGLSAQAGVTATASNNIANAGTAGYARQEAVVVDIAGAGAFGGGAMLMGVTQKRDRFVEAQLPLAFGQAAYSKGRSDALGSVTALDPGAPGGIDGALSAFLGSLQALSQDAGDGGLRQAVVSSATQLSLAFNRTAQGLAQARSAVDAQLAGAAPEVNRLASQVAQLNIRIVEARSTGAQPNDLLDARQRAVDQLAQLTGATQVQDASGNVALSLPGGEPLVQDGRAAQLSVIADPANRGHLAMQLVRADGTGPVRANNLGGSIGGQLAGRDGPLADAETAIDQLAFDLGSAMNAAHAAGYALDGTTGHALFDVGTSAAGAASRMAVDSAVAANPALVAAAGSAAAGAGDATNLLALQAVASQPLSAGTDANTTFANVVSRFGSAASGAAAMAAQDSAVQDHLSAMRDSSSGVSIDEELIHMQQAQRTYEAISRVLTATTSMLDALLSIGK